MSRDEEILKFKFRYLFPGEKKLSRFSDTHNAPVREMRIVMMSSVSRFANQPWEREREDKNNFQVVGSDNFEK